MQFTLAHGAANDFVVVADLADALELSAVLARALADRRRGVGADGVIRIAPSDDADVFMDHRNADGSHAEMCGNGVRVVAKYVVDRGIVVPGPDGSVRVDTRAGVRTVLVRRGDDGRVAEVSVDMGPPRFAPSEVPFEADDPAALLHQVEVDGDNLSVGVVSLGNPHAVVAVDDVGLAPVATVGPRLESHRRFPAKTNVGFAEVVSDAAIRLRVWERGVGETAACGTGACAAVVVLQRLGRVGTGGVAVQLPGGELTIDHEPGGTVTMTGPAVEIATGTVDDAWLAATLHDPREA